MMLRMQMTLLFSTFLLLMAAAPAPKPEDAVPRVSVDDVRAALARNDAVLVDVRGDVPYELEHIRGALSIPIGLVAERLSQLPPDKMIVTYCTCKTEELSVTAVLAFEKVGRTRAAALQGGLQAWKAAGLATDAHPAAEALEAVADTPIPVAGRSGGRVAPPAAVRCDRNDLTSYNGKVTEFRRTKEKTTIRIATDWSTDETATAVHPIYLVNGEPMQEPDWKRDGIGVGGRANVWVCRQGGFEPVIDWRPGEKGGPAS